MDDLTTWLISVAWPVVKKVLSALGVGILSYTGLTSVWDQMRDNITASWGAVGGATLQVASLAGIPDALGILLAAFAVHLVFITMGKLGIIASS